MKRTQLPEFSDDDKLELDRLIPECEMTFNKAFELMWKIGDITEYRRIQPDEIYFAEGGKAEYYDRLNKLRVKVSKLISFDGWEDRFNPVRGTRNPKH